MMMRFHYSEMSTPIGPLCLAADGDNLIAVHIGTAASLQKRLRSTMEWHHSSDALAEAVHQVTAYFAGELREFSLPLAPVGTPFQQRVWKELRSIPYGVTVSYGEIARRIGAPDSARAIGAANGQNPIAIVVPCHRVIGANGALTGYGGGMERKRYLLDLESGVASRQLALI
jgi:methylated-DNA-[protein]-cysteine S-methyltransferase